MNNKKIIKTKNKKIKTKSNKTKSNKTKSNKTKSNKTKSNKTIKSNIIKINNKILNNKILNNKINKAELNILINTITNEIIFLVNRNNSKQIIKNKIIKLLKEIRINDKVINKNTTDKNLIYIFNIIYKNSILLNKNIQKKNIKNKSNYKGGFYFKNIEDKGDQPITGNDMVKLLDEMQHFFSNAQYTDEGEFIKAPNTLLNLFRGDTDSFKSYITYSIIPKYIQMFPPFIKWDAISKIFKEKKYEDIPDYLLAYQSYMRSRDEYLVEKGLKSPDILKRDLYTGFYDKLANSMDENITAFGQYRSKLQGKAPLQLPL